MFLDVILHIFKKVISSVLKSSIFLYSSPILTVHILEANGSRMFLSVLSSTVERSFYFSHQLWAWSYFNAPWTNI